MSAITDTEVNSDLPNEWEGNLASAETSENSNTETLGSLSNEGQEDGNTEIEFVTTEDCFHSIFGADPPDWTKKEPKIEEEETYLENARIMLSSSSYDSIQDGPSTHTDKKTVISHEQYQSALKAKIKCPNCYFTTINRGNLKQHMKKHEIPEGRTYICDICDFKSKYKNSMKNHKARHEETGPKRRKK